VSHQPSQKRDGFADKGAAYSQVLGNHAIAGLCLAAIPVIATLAMPNYYLGKQQNAADGKGLDGRQVNMPYEAAESDSTGRKWYHALRDVYRK